MTSKSEVAYAGNGAAFKWLGGLGARGLAITLFRTLSFAIGAIIFLLYREDVPRVPFLGFIIIAGTVYTIFKITHPLQWYRIKALGAIIISADLAIVFSLVIVSGGVHSPFMLYAFSPFTTAALLLSLRMTTIICALSAIVILLFGLFVPALGRVEAVEHLSMMSVYLFLLFSIGALPYIINAGSKQRLMSTAKVDERRKLGRQMHDGICQTVCALRWQLQVMGRENGFSEPVTEELKKLGLLVEEAEQNTRGFINVLRTVNNDRPLTTAIQDYLFCLAKETGIDGHLEADNEPELDDLIKVEVLDIAIEALRNVVKHSGAKEVTVSILPRNGHLEVKITDDGKGFNPDFRSSRGMTVMKERAESVGGRLTIESSPGAGARVTLHVPRRLPLEKMEVLR